MEQGRSEAVFMDEISTADKDTGTGTFRRAVGVHDEPPSFFRTGIIEPASFLLLCLPFLSFLTSPLCLFPILRSASYSDPPHTQIHLM